MDRQTHTDTVITILETGTSTVDVTFTMNMFHFDTHFRHVGRLFCLLKFCKH